MVVVVVLVAIVGMPITASATTETIEDERGRYVGETRNGKAYGHGVYTHDSGGRYEGEWRNGTLHGRGVFTWSNGNRYEGEFRENQFHGRGVFTSTDGARYEGEFRDGKQNGRGVFTWSNGNRYEGEFRENQSHGRGVFTWTDGARYEGEYRDGKKNGRGVFTSTDGARYEGEFRDGKQNGRGVFTWSNGNRYEGEYRDGKQNGRGVFTAADGKRWEGNYVDGQAGRGTWTQSAASTGSGATTTAAPQSAASTGSGATTTAARGTETDSSAGDTTGAGNALACLSIEDKSQEYEYPNLWITNKCKRRVVVHTCAAKISRLPICRRQPHVTVACGRGNRPISTWAEEFDVPPTSWKDQYYGHFLGLEPNTRTAVICTEDAHIAACFYNAEGGIMPAGDSGDYFQTQDPRYVFESDKDGTFRCRWGDQISGDIRGREY